jgi:hypothetical protein
MKTKANDALEKAIKDAERMGKRQGESAAEWVAQDAFGGRHTGDSEQAARDFLRMSEDGDPELFELYKAPDLSGEWSDDMTPRELIAEVYNGEKMLDESEGDEICEAYEEASASGFWQRLEESAAAVLAD